MEKKKTFILNVFYYGAILGLLLLFCKYLLPVLLPFVIAFVIAAIFQIPAKKIAGTSKKGRKICALFLCFLCYLAIITGLLLLSVKLIRESGNMMTTTAEFYMDTLEPFLKDVSGRLQMTAASVNPGLAEKVEQALEKIMEGIGECISDLSVKAVKWVPGVAKGIPGFLVKIVITIVTSFFFAADFEKMMGLLEKSVPDEKRRNIQKGIESIKHFFGIYLKSYSLLFFITFIELTIGLLVMRIPYAILIALGIAVFDILPVLGTGGILLPWSVILLLMQEVPRAAGILILYLVITVIRNILEPKLVGRQIGLHPIATLLAMFVGLRIFGFVGMIGLPVGLAITVNFRKSGVFER